MLTEKQANVLHQAVDEDCQVTNVYHDEFGDSCIVGHLADLAGISVPKNLVTFDGSDKPVSEFLAKRLSRFGLSYKELIEMQAINDGYVETVSRRKALHGFIMDITFGVVSTKK